MNETELITQIYKNFGEGKIEDVLAAFDPKIEWHECKSFPYSKSNDGIFIGPQAVLENIFANIPQYIDGFNVEVKELFGCNEKVTMVGYYQGTWKETGKAFKANATHVWTVKDNKAIHFFQAVDTAEIMLA